MSVSQVTVSADVVTFTLHNDVLKVLLIKRSDDPFKDTWALPGGVLQANETAAEAAMRVLHDKAGVSDVFIEQLYTFDDPSRDVRGRTASIAHYALVPFDKLKIRKGKTTQEPTLFPILELPRLAFDHDHILDVAYERLRSKIEYSNIVFSLLPRYFTFAQLQQTYEIILGRELDKRNFRKRYMSLGLIEPTGKILEGGRHRPAKLFQFTQQASQEIQRWI